jgi:protein tyrosine/serine phosphatase
MKRWYVAVTLVICLLIAAAIALDHDFTGERDRTDPAPVARPSRWAERMEVPGAPNFHKVSDDLYRGAQPDEEGFREIEKLGVKTVVNLRSFHSDRDELEGTGLGYEHIWMKAWHPEDHEVVRFLEIVTDPGKTPVFVHCQHGADRTGTMSAIYRIVIQGWAKEDAIREMTEGGYGFHTVWDNLIDYIEKLDAEALRESMETNAAAEGRAVDTMQPPE